MSLLKNANTANANEKPVYEGINDGDTATATAEAPAATANAKVESVKTTAVAEKASTAVVKAVKVDLNALTAFKDALTVEYNTLNQITAQQGAFLDRETKTNLGDTVVFELISYQDSYVVSPEDDDAPDEMVRYSDDGVTCSDGTSVQDHLDYLHNNDYPKAKLKQRVVVVGAIESAAKSDKFNGSLVQFDLSPASRVQWNRFMANAAYGLKIGKFTADKVNRVKAETSLAQGKGNDTYTLVQFNVAG